jgi:hypothetical protein
VIQRKTKAEIFSPRECRNRLCRQRFTPSPRFPNSPYCVSCTLDRQLQKQKRKAEKQVSCKLKSCKSRFVREKPSDRFCSDACRKIWWADARQKAIDRKRERRTKRKLKKNKGGAYPHAGFQKKRVQLKLFEAVCAVTGMTNSEHVKKFGTELHLDHIVPARLAQDANGDPHNDVNMMPLCNAKHGLKKKAEEFIRRADPYNFVLELQKNGWPMERVKNAMRYYQMYSENLPWGD